MNRKYEPPVLMPLGAPVQAVGASCSGGGNPGGNDPNCRTGGNAGGGLCQAGNRAGSVCLSGGQTGGLCNAGSVASPSV